MKTRKIRIGITMGSDNPYESLFSNGIRQNIIILRELYEKCESVEKAYIINTSDLKLKDHPNSPLYPYKDNIITVSQAADTCDLIVVCNGSLYPEEYELYSSKGIKIVKLSLGSQQGIFLETVLFMDNKAAFNIYKKNNFVSKVWISEHYYENEKYFHETLYDTEVKIAPYVWDPRFIEERISKFSEEDKKFYPYKPRPGGLGKISVFEPNVSIAKNSLLPTIIIEKYFKKYPDKLKEAHVFNTKSLRSKRDFIDYCTNMKSHKSGILSFEDNMVVVDTLKKYTDIVLSHQTGNALNYLYLDVSWFGYPLVHNSDLMKDLAWYYPKNNADIAVEHLNYIIENFDKNYEEYYQNSRKFAERYLINNKKNIEDYNLLIEEVME